MKLSKTHKEQVIKRINRMYTDILRLELIIMEYETSLHPSDIINAKECIQSMQYGIEMTKGKDNE